MKSPFLAKQETMSCLSGIMFNNKKLLIKIMANSINLAGLGANDFIACNNAAYAGAIKVLSAEAGNVTFEIDGKEINLSDAGCSYLSTSLEAINKAKAEANPSEVLLVLGAKSSSLISPTEAANPTVKAGASETSFAKGVNEIDLAGVSTIIKFNHIGKTGEINVLDAKPGCVTIQVDGNVIELSDAGASYISNEYSEIKMADAEADPTQVLFALKGGSTKLVSATKVSNGKIAAKAIDTVFVI